MGGSESGVPDDAAEALGISGCRPGAPGADRASALPGEARKPHLGRPGPGTQGPRKIPFLETSAPWTLPWRHRFGPDPMPARKEEISAFFHPVRVPMALVPAAPEPLRGYAGPSVSSFGGQRQTAPEKPTTGGTPDRGLDPGRLDLIFLFNFFI